MTSILHIITTINRGGAENQLLILAEEQVLRGEKVGLVFLKNTAELEADFKQIGVEVVSQFADLNPLRQVILLRRYLSSQDTIVHAHLPRAELIARFSVAQHIFIVSRHNAEAFFPGAPKILSIILSRFVTRRSNLCIAISHAVRNYLHSSNEISPKTISAVVHYGYQKRRVLKSRTLSDGIKDFRIGTIARLVNQKDYPTLLRAFAIITEKIPQATLSIVGAGPLESNLKKLADELGIRNRVEWLGRRSDIDNFLQNIDLFLLTSVYEGFGLVLLEAMGNQVPIIAARNSAIPEVIGNFPDSLFETGNYLDLSKRILANFSEDSRAFIVQRQLLRLNDFDSVFMCNKILSLYKQLEDSV
jgi:glycosyltransferase involved in cell wall biosynthesis